MSGTGFVLESVDDLGPEETACLRSIYEDGFPPYQRDSFEVVTAGRQEGELALALTDRTGVPCGFAMLRPLGDTGWIFLRYFVVDSSQRGQGLGGVLWDLLTARLSTAGYTLLVFDVEDPKEPSCEPVQSEIRFRRIRFYQRHGASLLPVTGYHAPHVAPESSGWSPMLLMTAPLAGAQPLTEQILDSQAVASAVYRFRYELEPDDFALYGKDNTWPLTSS
jgi:GNAT superfamily N-acetyltransferase